jgi:hypothetical protein
VTENHGEKGDHSEDNLPPISIILKPKHFISEILLDAIGIRTVSSGLNLHAVSRVGFNADLMECVVPVATEDPEWQDTYNMGKH